MAYDTLEQAAAGGNIFAYGGNIVNQGPSGGIDTNNPTTPVAPAAPKGPLPTAPDYTLHPGETVDQYNTRIAQYRTPAPAATPTPAPTQPATPQIDTAGMLSKYTTARDALQNETDSVLADVQARHQMLLNGTFPLTPSQQNLYDATQASFNTLRQNQVIANETYQQGLKTYEARTGEAQGGTTTAMGNVQNAINQGTAKITEIDARMASTLAQMKTAFEQDNLKMVDTLYNDAMTGISEKQKNLQAMYDATTQAAKDLRDFTIKQSQQQFDNNLATKKEGFSEAIQTLDKKLQAAQIDETQRHNIVAEATAKEVANNGRYENVPQADGSTAIFDKQTRTFIGNATNEVLSGQMTPGQTGNPLLDTNTKLSSTGVPFIDGTNLTGKQAVSVQLQAAKMGIPYLGKEQAAALANLAAAKNDITQMGQLLTELAPSSGFTRPFVSFGHWLESATQIGPGAVGVGSYANYRNEATKYIQGLAAGGTGLRINQAQIEQMIKNIPSYNDTAAVANGKINVLTALLNSNERSMVGQKAYDAYNPGQAAQDLAALYKSNPDKATFIDTLRTQGLNPQQIMQVLLP